MRSGFAPLLVVALADDNEPSGGRRSAELAVAATPLAKHIRDALARLPLYAGLSA